MRPRAALGAGRGAHLRAAARRAAAAFRMTQAIVIGAGAAGLRAAVALRKAGRQVLVLEARDRIGGRIHTVEDRELGATLELGAEFVHGDLGELKRSRLRLEDMDGRHLSVVDGALRDVTRDFYGVLAQLAKATGAGTAQSWLARSELPPLGRELAPCEAEKLSVTLPVGVLLARAGQEGAVRFDPPLKRKREALAWLRMGSVVKAVLRFREPVWATRQVRKADFVHAPGAAFPTWWRAGPPELPLVIGWAGGPAASRLGKGDPLPAALASLARVLGRSASDLEGLLESA